MRQNWPVTKIDVSALGEYIREQRQAAQLSLRQLARAADVSNPYLSQVERGLRKPSAEILTQIAGALRISAETLYVQAGLLEAQDGARVPAAISADATLTERQRRALLEIYAAFQAENSNAERTVSAPSPDQPVAQATSATEQSATDAPAPEAAHTKTDIPVETPNGRTLHV